MNGTAPWWFITFTVTLGGASSRTRASNAPKIAPGSWSATSRMLILAAAKLGSTVLAPAPM